MHSLRLTHPLAAALVPLLFATLGCSSEDISPLAKSDFVARFELEEGKVPDLLEVPFPSDLWLADDGTIALPGGIERVVPSADGAGFLADAFARTRGWGTYSGAFFELGGGAPDRSKLPTGKAGDCTGKDAPIYVIDVTAGAALECRAWWSDDAPFGQEDTTPVLSVNPARGVVVPEGHLVAVVLTSSVVTADGHALAASPGLAAIRDGERATPAAKLYGQAIDGAKAFVGDAARIASVAAYTTGHVTEDMRDGREAAAKAPLPELGWGAADVAPVAAAKFSAEVPLPAGWTASLDDLFGAPNQLPDGTDDPDFGSDNPGVAHDAIASFGVASIEAPNLLVDAKDYGSPEHGTLYRGEDGKAAVNPDKPTARVWITFVVPKATMPAAGYPVVVFQHGLQGQRADVFQIADSFAKRGWATAAIEPVLQGTRANDATDRGDTKNDTTRSSSTYQGPDGFTDRSKDGSNATPIDLFGGLVRIAAMRDQLRQSAIDHTTLVRLLRSSPVLDGLAAGGTTPKIDGTQVAYLGDSLGGILGALTASIEPGHAAYVLNVAGGGVLVDLAPYSPQVGPLMSGAAGLLFGLGGAQIAPQHPLAVMMQHVLDGGDPIAGAPFVVEHPAPAGGAATKARNVLMFEAVFDEIVSNESTDGLARAIGARLVAPHLEPLTPLEEVDAKAGAHDVPHEGATDVIIQLSPAQHGWDLFVKHGHRSFAAHRAVYGDPTAEVFTKLAEPAPFDNPYLDAQAAALDFIAAAFAGGVPSVTWTKAPAPVGD